MNLRCFPLLKARPSVFNKKWNVKINIFHRVQLKNFILKMWCFLCHVNIFFLHLMFKLSITYFNNINLKYFSLIKSNPAVMLWNNVCLRKWTENLLHCRWSSRKFPKLITSKQEKRLIKMWVDFSVVTRDRFSSTSLSEMLRLDVKFRNNFQSFSFLNFYQC